ncbi:MAG: bifunctional phosphopantothenoylcysteine decarboxylase/phosphopantothenate--cysteine ligase CoaBC [Rhodospirillaceae bacterium]|nr:bifunctional phosphopantothenoylcysteine decarboxylase/phosphopantothenate--cysteine ligase CoaBC [Rhodospirillaceae bacterium]
MLNGKKVFLIIAGGIAAYKCLDLIRRLREQGASVRCCLTENAKEFVTPLSVSALSQGPVYTDQFSLKDESEMSHIELSRASDILVVAPATADVMAKMAAGLADQLATTLVLATDKPVLIAPAMNLRMWLHAATQANLATLMARGIHVVGPNEGPMACNEFGPGRMAEVPEIIAAIDGVLSPVQSLAGCHAIVTSGPTVEPIDPVRFIANRSSGKQGHAIAAALAAKGARVTLVSGPTALPDPVGVTTVSVETACEMLAACQSALPADIVVCAAAVADWGIKAAEQKLKKRPGGTPPVLELTLNPDILATLSAAGPNRPRLVVGFAAETEDLIAHARDKRSRKGCDWIVANDVSAETGTFGSDTNQVHLISAEACESWPSLDKRAVATRLADRIAEALS